MTLCPNHVLSSIPQVDLWGEIPQQRIPEFLSLTVVYHGKSNDVTAVGSINSFVHKIGANLNPCIFRETESQDRNISEQKMPGEKILAPENRRYFYQPRSGRSLGWCFVGDLVLVLGKTFVKILVNL